LHIFLIICNFVPFFTRTERLLNDNQGIIVYQKGENEAIEKLLKKIAIRKKKAEDAYNSTTRKKRTYYTYRQKQVARFGLLSAASRCLRKGVHHNSEET